jgi:hypothetical protein
MKRIRKQNALLFDSLVLLVFAIVAFAAYPLVDTQGAAGAVVAISLLIALCLVLVSSR